MPIANGVYQSPKWANGRAPAINATEMNAISDTLAKVPVGNGGTGATTASAARTNLGIGSVATENVVPVSKGGTGATSASAARKNLGVPKITFGTSAPSGGSDGDVYFQYTK